MVTICATTKGHTDFPLPDDMETLWANILELAGFTGTWDLWVQHKIVGSSFCAGRIRLLSHTKGSITAKAQPGDNETGRLCVLIIQSGLCAKEVWQKLSDTLQKPQGEDSGDETEEDLGAPEGPSTGSSPEGPGAATEISTAPKQSLIGFADDREMVSLALMSVQGGLICGKIEFSKASRRIRTDLGLKASLKSVGLALAAMVKRGYLTRDDQYMLSIDEQGWKLLEEHESRLPTAPPTPSSMAEYIRNLKLRANAAIILDETVTTLESELAKHEEAAHNLREKIRAVRADASPESWEALRELKELKRELS